MRIATSHRSSQWHCVICRLTHSQKSFLIREALIASNRSINSCLTVVLLHGQKSDRSDFSDPICSVVTISPGVRLAGCPGFGRHFARSPPSAPWECRISAQGAGSHRAIATVHVRRDRRWWLPAVFSLYNKSVSLLFFLDFFATVVTVVILW